MPSNVKAPDTDHINEQVEELQNELHELIRLSPPWYKSTRLIQLYLLLIAPLLTSTSWGFDLSMTNGLQSVDIFMERFGHPSGSSLGFYGASTAIGGLVACIVGGYFSDLLGRKLLCSLGAGLVIAAGLLQTFSINFPMFIGGKVLIGLGSNLQQVAAPVLITELAHPKNRVFISSFYNTNIFFGLIIGAWITFGTYRLDSQWSWKIPCILQIALPIFQVFMIWFCPESPRWLVSKGRYEEAKKILIKYHSSVKDTEDSIVRVEMQEIIASIDADKTRIKLNKEGIKSIIYSKGNRHRLWICFWVAIGSQCGGGTFIASYLPQIMDQIGMTSSKDKTLMNAIMNICNWVMSVVAVFIIPRVGRRKVFLVSTIGQTAAFTVWTAMAKSYLDSSNPAFGKAVLAMMFTFNFFQAPCWIPLVIAYPVETLTTKQRGVLFSLHMFMINAGAFISQYINPVGLEKLSWRWYIFQIVFNACLIVVIYFTFVETNGYMLEEIAAVFDGQEGFNAAHAAARDALKAEDAIHMEALPPKPIKSA